MQSGFYKPWVVPSFVFWLAISPNLPDYIVNILENHLCIKRDSNSYAVRHQVLNLGCLPIPPLMQLRFRPLNRFYITTISFAERFVSFQVTYLPTTLIIRFMVFYIPITTILQIIVNWPRLPQGFVNCGFCRVRTYDFFLIREVL